MPTSRVHGALLPMLLLSLNLISCGPGDASQIVPQQESQSAGSENNQDESAQPDQPQPGIYDAAGFFPVRSEALPVRFVIVGDMGGPVLYSSKTVPAWVAGSDAFLLSPDGSLLRHDLSEDELLHLPPDIVPYSMFEQYREADSADRADEFSLPGEQQLEELQLETVETDELSSVSRYPLSVSVLGPASAAFMLDDKRLYRVSDGAIVVLRRFGPELSGVLRLSGSPMEIIVNDSNGQILALDTHTGDLLWENSGGPVLLSGGRAVFVGEDSLLHIHESHDGQAVAVSDLADFSLLSRPTRDATSIYASLQDGRLVATDNDAKIRWIAETRLTPRYLVNDVQYVYVLSKDSLVVYNKNDGAELQRLDLPVSPAGAPLVLEGSLVYAGTDGRVYASVSFTETPVPVAAYPGERVAAVISFRLEKYVRVPSDQLLEFMPYVDGSVHEGISAFSVFAYGPVQDGGEHWLTWDGEDRDVVLALFNEQGDELRANLDEFGTHDTFSYRFDENGLYYIALGRQDPEPDKEPVFLSVIPARRD